MTRSAGLGILTALALIATPAWAEKEMSPVPTTQTIDAVTQGRHLLTPVFEVLDCDDKGYIDGGDVDEHMREVFAALLTTVKYHANINQVDDVGQAQIQARHDAIVKIIDADSSGGITYREYRNYLLDLIAQIDANQDGDLLPEELFGTDG